MCIVSPFLRPHRSFKLHVLCTASKAKLLRPKEELLKQLLTSVYSADHHLVLAPGLPSYRMVVHPYLTEGSKLPYLTDYFTGEKKKTHIYDYSQSTLKLFVS